MPILSNFQSGSNIHVDANPISGSTNAVSSGGVYTALEGKSPEGHTHKKLIIGSKEYDGSSEVSVDKSAIGLGSVENKSSSTIRSEITESNITNALGYTPAELDSNGKVITSQLPSYIDDVIEAAAKSSFPTTGETGKIYVDTSTNKTYRWSGSSYVEISASLALGETSSTAYRGDRGKIAYDHSNAAHARTDATKVEASSTNGNIKIDGAETTVYTQPTATSSALGGVKIGSNINISDGKISVPTANGTTAGVTIVYPAASCTTFSSDSGTVTPLAVQKGAKMFAITRPSATTNKAIARYSDTTGNVQNSKIIIEDVTNTRDTSKQANVLAIPAEGNKKMVYGYCTDQVDGTSFIGGVFDADATEYPYSAGLAIGGTSGNLLWKGAKVATVNDIPSVPVKSVNGKTGAVSLTYSDVGAAASSHGTHVTTATVKSALGTGSGTTKYLREDGTWAVPPDTNTTYSAATQSAAGLMSADDKEKLDGIATGANKITVDTALSSTSTNPVQNKVINSALSGKANSSHGNHVPATETANNAKFLRNDNTWQTVTPANIGAAEASHNHSASNITSGTLAVARGGTGQTSLKATRNAMGLGNTTGALPIANGGTGATAAAAALSNLGGAPINHNHTNQSISPVAVDLHPSTSAGHGGYIDFNYNSSDTDYTTRLIEHNAGHLYMNIKGVSGNHQLHTTYTKPQGTYSGNGSSTSRTVNTGGIGSLIMVGSQSNGGYVAFVTPNGAFIKKGTTLSGLDQNAARFVDGVLTLATTDPTLNAGSTTYGYYVI